MSAAELAATLMRQYARTPLLVILLVVVPPLFITLSYYTTAPADLTVFVRSGGERVALSIAQPEVHLAIMPPITAAFLSGVAGLFVMLEASRADQRLVVAGVPAARVAVARLLMIAVMAVAVAGLSVPTALINLRPGDSLAFLAANVLVAIAYGFIGALISLVVGRLGGAYLMFFIPMMDVGIFQDPMFISGDQPLWMQLLPGFGGTRFAIDAAFSGSGDDWVALGAASAWVVLLAAATMAVFVRRSRG
ncbi:MAG: ABC transporter permease [Dehalococcoidia bacterium]|nr:ABC transporter permease [Dehalococcoidia bacterium]NUQ55474.1 ABC transporter permease [Dehalococcoidia bacterium]